jgi:cytochrome c oxidase assembly factor 6
MGWLPWSSGDSNKASDGGRIAPDRTSRARCWEGRDAFFACLDRNDILDGIKDDKEARRKCAKEVAEFEAACSATWVRANYLCRAICSCLGENESASDS